MQIENEGIHLWYGTSDAPAPDGEIQLSDDLTIIVGVRPIDANNKVEIHYRIDQGPSKTVPAQWWRNALAHKAQYFLARFLDLRVGDTVEYTVVCRCAGRQVPDPRQAQQLMHSFRVVAAKSEPITGQLPLQTALPQASMALKPSRSFDVPGGSTVEPSVRPPAQPKIAASPPQRASSSKTRSAASPRLAHAPIGTLDNPPQRGGAVILRSGGQVPDIPNPPLAELNNTFGLNLQPGLLQALNQRGIRTLEDVRKAGALRHVQDLPVAADDPAVQKLEAHAHFSVLSPDLQVNAKLIEKGYLSSADIASVPRMDFVSKLGGEIDDVQASRMHTEARAGTVFLNNILAHISIDLANGLEPVIPGDPTLELLPIYCGCEDCDAAVSPLAYLADLLQYALTHIKDAGQLITLDYLIAKLRQPLAELPMSCASASEEVLRVRLCVEALRRHLGNRPLSGQAKEGKLQRSEQEYRIKAYTMLLTRIGVSYEELRLARTASERERNVLAERLGLGQPDLLNALRLDISAEPQQPSSITEERLESLFGLLATARHDGTPLNPLRSVSEPELLKWRRDYLRQLWQQADWPAESPPPVSVVGNVGYYNQNPLMSDWPGMLPTGYQASGLTIVRETADIYPPGRFAASATAAGTEGYISQEVDVPEPLRGGRLTIGVAAKAAGPLPAFNRALEFDGRDDYAVVADSPRFNLDKSATFETWIYPLGPGSRAESTLLSKQESFGLARFPDGTIRWALAYDHAGWIWVDTGYVAHERRWTHLAMVYDADNGVVTTYADGRPEHSAPFGNRIGISHASLYIGGEAVAERTFAGLIAEVRIWEIARTQAEIENDLHRRLGGREQGLLAYWRFDEEEANDIPDQTGKTNPCVLGGGVDASRPQWRSFSEEIRLEIWQGPRTGNKSKSIERSFTLGEEWVRYGALGTSSNDAQVIEVRVYVMNQARLGSLFVELGQGLDETPPLIDPDIISDDHCVSGAARRLWSERRDWIRCEKEGGSGCQVAGLKNFGGTPQTRMDQMLRAVLQVEPGTLGMLAAQQDRGNDIAELLLLVGLSSATFSYLRRMQALVASGADLMASEWDEVYNILVQVLKRRKFAEWRTREKQAGVILGPEHFKIPTPDLFQVPPQKPEPPPVWRGTIRARRDWEDLLQSRIEQDQALINGLYEAVSATEAEILPLLRDALIEASRAQGTFEAEAKELANLLLIDMQASGCQKTTRVAQAIESIQMLIWSVRNGRLLEAYPTLTLEADDFDEEWIWIGSYANWRAAMFVFLYPENILLPTLRQPEIQTYGFLKLVETVRTKPRLTPEDACAAAKAYADYYRDICQLSAEATCRTRTRVLEGECRDMADMGYRDWLYVFARGRYTGAIYWSAYDLEVEEESGHRQTPWYTVPVDTTLNILGAVPYKTGGGNRYVYLFLQGKNGEGEQTLLLTRYNVEARRWDDTPMPLDLPDKEVPEYIIVVKQSVSEDDPPHLAFQGDRWVLGRQLSLRGDSWAGDAWQVLLIPEQRELRLRAMIGTTDGVFCLITDSHLGEKFYNYRVFGMKNPFPYPLGFYNRQLSWIGGFAWPVTKSIYCFGYQESFKTTEYIQINVLESPYQGIRLTQSTDYAVYDPTRPSWVQDQLGELNDWLMDVVGFSLRDLKVRDVFSESRAGFQGIGERPLVLVLNFSGSTAEPNPEILNWIDEQTRSSPEWKYVDDLMVELTGMHVREVIEQLLNGNSVDLPTKNHEESQPRVLDDGIFHIVQHAGGPDGSSASGQVYDKHHLVYSREPVPEREPIPLPEDVSLSLMRTTGELGMGTYKSSVTRDTASNNLTESMTPARIAPQVDGPFDIVERLSAHALQSRRQEIIDVFEMNMGGPSSNLVYLEEAYYFVPLHLALQLQRRGHYQAALDWLRTIYDYTVQQQDRKIYYGLELENSLSEKFARADDWLLDPLNPHAIASTRARTYTRFTLISLVSCLIAYADDEFTRDTAESVPRARALYLTALDILNLPELNQRLGRCLDIIDYLNIKVGETVTAERPDLRSGWRGINADLVTIKDYALLKSISAAAERALDTEDSWQSRLAIIEGVVREAKQKQSEVPNLATFLEEKRETTRRVHARLLVRPEISEAVRKVSHRAGSGFLHAINFASSSDERATGAARDQMAKPGRNSRIAASPAGDPNPGLQPRFARSSASSAYTGVTPSGNWADLGSPTLQVGRVRDILTRAHIDRRFCIPPNPVLRGLRLQAEMNLHKLRNCRNIAGMQRELEPYAAATDTETGLPVIGAGGQLVLPGTVTLRPTPYRYQVLAERAKHLTQLAAQMESAMLAALEKRDAEYYNLLKARQEVRLAQSGVRLQNLRLKEAEDGVKLSNLQQDLAQIQVDTYQEWIDVGMLSWERAMIDSYQAAGDARVVANQFSAMGQAAQAATTAAAGGMTGAAAATPLAALATLLFNVSHFASAIAIMAETTAQVASVYANYERSLQQWNLQKNIAQQEVLIGAQQVAIAEDHVGVVEQEQEIAELQSDHAKETMDFLANKFTNVELYDWMSGVLEQVYSFFLQQATATAKLAENQLAFERQEPPPAFIQSDYWEAPSGFESGVGGRGPDRRGLTGSARLLQDIYQLDQYAFETDRRKLQLTKTVSLASHNPYEFQRFRESGVLVFATPMEVFDRDFPGHYLRLIKRVRTSIIALIPPTEGIHATLSTTGLSRVVIGPEIFQSITIRRNPESVALTSPRDATGLFELQPQSDMLLPFEGMGVDATWELRLPKASNSFDFNTLTDVLITIEYTALDSFTYRQQVLQKLDNQVSADRPFSFRHQFADQWYDLHNPEQTTTPMVVRFRTVRADFPPNIEDLKIQHIVLYFTRRNDQSYTNGQSFEVPVTSLRFTERGSVGAVGGGATSIDGVISTRRGNAGSWICMIGKSPIGEWELALPNTQEMRNRFKNEKIEDILFVITASGRTPEWPT